MSQEHTDKYEAYYRIAKLYPSSQGLEVSPHITDIIASVMMTRDNFLTGGSFAQAVVNNDLRGVIRYGDEDCLKNIRLIFMAYENAFL